MTSMGRTLWDGADQLAGLGDVGTAGSAADVPAGASDQLVRPGASKQDVGGATADHRILSAATREGAWDEFAGPGAQRRAGGGPPADHRTLPAATGEQVGQSPADQAVAAGPARERTRLSIDHSAQHHVEPRIGVEGVAAPGEV